MTAYSLWLQSASGRTTVTADANPYTLGTQFSVTQAAALTGIWFYSGIGATVLPAQCVLFNADTQAQVPGTLVTPSWSGAAGSGWVKCQYDGTITLTPGTHYVAAVYYGGGASWYSDAGTSGWWTTGPGAAGVTRGPLTAPDSAGALHGQAVFHAGTGVTFPVTTSSGFDFGIDVEVSTPVTDASDVSVTFSGSSGGISTYSVSSFLNSTGGAGAQHIRTLPPVNPNTAYPHARLWMLTVDPDQGTTFGDALAVAQAIGGNDAYNLTCVELGYPVGPWYGDNPLDNTTQQESFLLESVNWAKVNLATTGAEKDYLIGFSRSGLAAQFLVFRHPLVFARAASWDSPFMMSAYDGTDPDFGTVGGSPQQSFGTNANFTANYQLSAGNLAAWKAASNFGTVNRIWTGGHFTFGGDLAPYRSALATAGILSTSTWDVLDSSHAWHADWVKAALDAMIPRTQQGSGVAPLLTALGRF